MDARIALAAFALLVAAPAASGGQDAGKKDEALAAALRKAVDANLETLNKEDVDGHVATVHSKSPAREQIGAMVRQICQNYDLNYKVKSFRFVGADGDYAYVRVAQDTTKIAGPAFRNNTTDVLHVLKQEDGGWKLWTSAVLELKFHE